MESAAVGGAPLPLSAGDEMTTGSGNPWDGHYGHGGRVGFLPTHLPLLQSEGGLERCRRSDDCCLRESGSQLASFPATCTRPDGWPVAVAHYHHQERDHRPLQAASRSDAYRPGRGGRSQVLLDGAHSGAGGGLGSQATPGQDHRGHALSQPAAAGGHSLPVHRWTQSTRDRYAAWDERGKRQVHAVASTRELERLS
jgi:hypothetical protein